MKNIEYTNMAKLYDKFYAKKNYKKEVDFIEHFIKDKSAKILDAGCGTGSHSKILFDKGYNIEGFDLNEEMLKIAKNKVNTHFEKTDILNYKSNKKFDLIFSFFAVFNHLKNYKQFQVALLNLRNSLSINGTIIIDLHNPQSKGSKIENIGTTTRIMRWNINKITQKETSKITYIVDNKQYKTKHKFKIFNLNKLEKFLFKIGFNDIKFFENYDYNSVATSKSKNIQIVINY